MAKEIYKSGNYIITVDADNKSRLFPIGKTVYDEHNSVFRITEGVIEDDQLTIAFSDSINWVDDSAAAYTEATLRTFLRDNTGFRPASGGSGAAPIGADLMKTGQTISYAANDDGDLQEGRDVDFYTLPSNNPFGTTARFTDELGGSTYANDIVIDWSTYGGTTVIGWSRLVVPATTWANHITNATAYSIGSFTSGWRLPNVLEIMSIGKYDNVSTALNYTPFNVTSTGSFSTSTTYRVGALSNSFNYMFSFNTGQLQANNKTNSTFSIRCRTFTVTGTTLT